MELEDYLWLLSDAAVRWLERAADTSGDTLRLAAALRKDLSASRTHLVLEQAELRRRAVAKFPAAERMFFTRKGLEQATDLWMARYKAGKLAGEGRTTDLCCGIGGDLIALAELEPVRAVDADPVAALLAKGNLAATGVSGTATVLAERVSVASLDNCKAWHLDPDRRSQGRRTVAMDQFEPPLDLVVALLKANPRAAIKLAPATEVPAAIAANAECEWISRAGECRQQVAWHEVGQGKRATVLDRDGTVLRTIAGEPCIPENGSALRYVYEPDSAILAARLEGLLAAEHDLRALGGGYLTGDRLVADGGLTAFEVIDAMPFDRKRVAAWLAERGIGKVEVKCRDGRHDANRLQRELASKGDGMATLLLAPLNKKTVALVARRV